MGTKRIVVVGASAGGIEALRELAARFPANFPAPVCVVLHMSPQSPGILDAILSHSGPLPAHNGRDRERLQAGHIYLPPPDCHLLVEPGLIRVTKGPRENRFRPAIDPLFRSAAQVYGPAAIGVILTGNLDDGTAGLWAIKQLGGIAIVQDPADAMFPAMAENALRHVRVDYKIPLAEIGPLLVRLTSEAAEPAEKPALKSVDVEVSIAMEKNPLDAGLHEIAGPSAFACPECHGVLLEIKEGGRIRFRCHTGHAYSLDSLLAAVGEAIEEAMWNAVRSLEEGQMLLRTMSEHIKTHGDTRAEVLLTLAEDAQKQAEAVRGIMLKREPLVVNS